MSTCDRCGSSPIACWSEARNAWRRSSSKLALRQGNKSLVLRLCHSDGWPMTETTTDELDRLDEAFAGNRLLSTFSAEARALIEPFGEITQLQLGGTVHARGADVESTYFLFGQSMVSLVVDLSDGRSVETASIGHEGAVGGIVSCGHAPAFARAQVLVAGPALRVPMSALEDAKMRSGHIRN